MTAPTHKSFETMQDCGRKGYQLQECVVDLPSLAGGDSSQLHAIDCVLPKIDVANNRAQC